MDDQVHLLTEEGSVYRWAEKNWEIGAFSVKPQARIIATDPVVACVPSSSFKANFTTGYCYSNAWRVVVNWYAIRPKQCGDSMVAIDKLVKGTQLKVFNLLSGRITSARVISQMPPRDIDLCQMTKQQ